MGDSVVFSSETPRGVSNTIDAKVVAIAKDMGFLSAWNVYMHDDSQGGEFNFALSTPSLNYQGNPIPAVNIPPTIFDLGLGLRMSL